MDVVPVADGGYYRKQSLRPLASSGLFLEKQLIHCVFFRNDYTLFDKSVSFTLLNAILAGLLVVMTTDRADYKQGLGNAEPCRVQIMSCKKTKHHCSAIE